ncbi:MAG: hypothetical protein ACRCV4_16415 [Hafnia alvei]
MLEKNTKATRSTSKASKKSILMPMTQAEAANIALRKKIRIRR